MARAKLEKIPFRSQTGDCVARLTLVCALFPFHSDALPAEDRNSEDEERLTRTMRERDLQPPSPQTPTPTMAALTGTAE